jgi:hypothetical protein
VNLRRTRVVIHGQAHPQLQVRLEFGLSDRLELLDTYALVPVRRWLQLQIGQFRVPFSRQELVRHALPVRRPRALERRGANSSGVRFIPSFDHRRDGLGLARARRPRRVLRRDLQRKGPQQPFNLDGFFLYAGRVVVNPLGRPRAFKRARSTSRETRRLAIGLNAAGQVRQIGTVTIGGAEVPNRMTTTALGADVYFAGLGRVVLRRAVLSATPKRPTRARGPPRSPSGGSRRRGTSSRTPPCATTSRWSPACSSFNPSRLPHPQRRGTATAPVPGSHTRENYRDFMNTTRDHLRGQLVPARARLQGPGLVHDLQ